MKDNMLPSLVIPGWFPPALADQVRKLHDEAKPEDRPVLCRLVHSKHIEKVWRYLYRQKRVNHRPTEDFFHSVLLGDWWNLWRVIANSKRRRAAELRGAGGADNRKNARLLEQAASGCDELHRQEQLKPIDPRVIQDAGVGFFLTVAFQAAVDGAQVMTRGEVDAGTKLLRADGEQLRREAEILRSHGMGEIHAQALERVASACEARAARLAGEYDDPPRMLVVDRDRGDKSLRGYVLTLAAASQRIFGDPLCGQVAIVANVALGRRDLTRDRVQSMLRAVRH
jgi:hypothetical protein